MTQSEELDKTIATARDAIRNITPSWNPENLMVVARECFGRMPGASEPGARRALWVQIAALAMEALTLDDLRNAARVSTR